MKFKQFLLWLKTPQLWFAIVWSVLSCLVIALTLTFLIIGQTNSPIIYCLYFLSAVFFSYLVYLIILIIPKIKQKIINSLKKHKITNQMLENYGYRSIIFAFFSFIINTAYAIFQSVFAILEKSIWLGSLALYYIALSIIRGRLSFVAKDNQQNPQKIKSYTNTGISLLVLNFALVASIVQMVLQNQGFAYGEITIFVFAAYAFYKLGLSIYNLFKAKTLKDYSIKALKNVSFADALVSILALQTALLAQFGADINHTIFNSISGAAISVTIIALGVYMIIKGTQIKKQTEDKNEQKI